MPCRYFHPQWVPSWGVFVKQYGSRQHYYKMKFFVKSTINVLISLRWTKNSCGLSSYEIGPGKRFNKAVKIRLPLWSQGKSVSKNPKNLLISTRSKQLVAISQASNTTYDMTTKRSLLFTIETRGL